MPPTQTCCKQFAIQDKVPQAQIISAAMPARTPPRTKKSGDATPFLPEKPTITTLRHASQNCRGCDLWKNATRTVFGEGNSRPSMMLIGEQPGDKEDLAGLPFVGPAGRILDE